MLLAILGLANAADAVEILSVGLLGTAAEKDLHLTPERVGALNACIFAGMFLGGILWGLLGDAFGEKPAALPMSAPRPTKAYSHPAPRGNAPHSAFGLCTSCDLGSWSIVDRNYLPGWAACEDT